MVAYNGSAAVVGFSMLDAPLVDFNSWISSSGVDYQYMSDSGQRVRLAGVGFAYGAPPNPVGGTVTSAEIDIFNNGFVDITITGMNDFLPFMTDNGSSGNAGAFTTILGGDDVVTGSFFNDTLIGMNGADTLIGGMGNDTLDGGAGVDTASYAEGPTVSVSLAIAGPQNTIGAGIDTLIGIENLIGTAGPDSFVGNDGNNVLTGGGGEDFLTGGLGDDTLDGGGFLDTANYQGGNAVTVSLAIVGPQHTIGAGIDTLIGIEYLNGSNFNDTLTGDAGGNNIFGNDGNDILNGGNGGDLLAGGNGTDTASYAGGAGVTVSLAIAGGQNTIGQGTDTLNSIENLTGSSNPDVLVGNGIDNVLAGGDGNDRLNGGLGNDVLDGGNGQDIADFAGGGAVNVSLLIGGSQNTGQGDDILIAIEELWGSAFDDVLTGNASNNTLAGYDGADTLVGGLGNDNLVGGAGVDTASYAGGGSVTVDLSIVGPQNTGSQGSDSLQEIENLIGTFGGDLLIGNSGANSLVGSDGEDELRGGLGDDTLDGGMSPHFDRASYAGGAAVTVDLSIAGPQDTGGQGVDTLISIEWLTGSSHGDTLSGDNADNLLIGGDGDDILKGGLGNDILDAGAGNDTASFAGGPAAIVSLAIAALQNTGQGQDGLIGVENLIGSSFADTLIGNAGANTLNGGDGADILDGLGGVDVMIGGAGDDVFHVDHLNDVASEALNEGVDLVLATTGSVTLSANVENLTNAAGGTFLGYGNASDNALTGGSGADQMVALGGADTANLGAGNDYYYAGDGADQGFGGADLDVMIGEAGNDTLLGGDAQDYLFGGNDADTLHGEAGVDVLHGESGDDLLFGGAGIDYFYAGIGADVGHGGDDVDIFVMDAGNDIVNGDAGADYVYAGNDNDQIFGGAGVDVILGEAGNDTVDGGTDVDYVWLGAGDDTFVMDTTTPGLNVDVLNDFVPGAGSGDVLRLLNTGWTTIAEVNAAMFNTGNGYSILTLDPDTQIWLIGITPGQLVAGDAVFS